jgi:hypothetical protein
MTTAEINAARKANRAAIESRLKAFVPGRASLPRRFGPSTSTLLTPTERANLIAAEAAKSKIAGCCGH